MSRAAVGAGRSVIDRLGCGGIGICDSRGMPSGLPNRLFCFSRRKGGSGGDVGGVVINSAG
jgi:hypothetical protein